MTEKSTTPENEDNAADLRGTLIKRLAVAGVLVAVLLGVLAFFDYLASPPDEPEAQVFTQPVPVAPKKEVSQPVTPAENLPEPPAAVSEPVVEAAVPAVADSKPEPSPESRPAAPSPAATAKTPSAPSPAATPAPVRPLSPAPVRQPSPASRSTPEASAGPSVASEPPVTASTKPAARVVETRSAPPAPPSGVARLFAGFVLQAGVFTSPQRAEELHAKLTLSGVPSTLETRVQVGPFSSRKEAEAAQVKLRELGVETILVPPKGGRL